MNKVSIIIPVFNYAFVIAETLRNLLDQSHQNWEAIIVDDGSTDNSREIIEGFTQVDSRFHYFYQENQGVSIARNFGLAKATGDFYQFLDGDDLLSEKKLSLQLEHFKSNPQIDISYTDSYYFHTENPKLLSPNMEMDGREWMHKLQGRGYKTVRSLIDQNIAVISSPLIKASVVLNSGARFREGKAFLEDWEFWLKLAFADYSYHYLKNPDAFTSIRLHSKSVSNRYLKEMKEEVLAIRLKMNELLSISSFSSDEKEELLGFNKVLYKGNFKRLMYHVGLWDFIELRRLKQHLSTGEFLKYYFKSINHQRKELFKLWIKQLR